MPDPTPILRFIHVDNLEICLRRNGLHAPNFTPEDGLKYRPIHNVEIQQARHQRPVRCGPGGVLHDYIPFYFGYLSPMMLQLQTGKVPDYNEGQEPLIYLVSTCQAVQVSGARFVFTNGHALPAYTDYFEDLAQLDQLDWGIVYKRYWFDTVDDMDRQRRKQAELLIYRFCNWSLIEEIAVINLKMKDRVERILAEFPEIQQRPIIVKSDWYY